MKAYFAIGDAATAARMLAGRRVLFSFAYVGTRWLEPDALARACAGAASVRIDSGGFTAWKQGKPIQLEAYARWLLKDAPQFEHAFALDAVGDHHETARRYRALVETAPALAPRVIPIWHEGAPFEFLDEYVTRAPVVGLGRIAGRNSELKTLAFYDEVFNRHPDARFHALGNANPKTLEPYPFDSFDATSWQRDAAYSNAAAWPFNRCTKETRMRAYIEATETIEYRPPKQLRMTWGAA